MPVMSKNDILDQLRKLETGDCSLPEFEDWLVQNSWNIDSIGDEAVVRAVGAIELRLAEHSSGRLPFSVLMDELAAVRSTLIDSCSV